MADRGNRSRKGGIQRRRNDPAVEQARKRAAENKAALTKKQRKDRKRTRATYDMPPELKTAIEEEASHEDISTSASQLGTLLLAYALKELRTGNWELIDAIESGKELSRTLQFEWNIDVPEQWFDIIENSEVGERRYEDPSEEAVHA